MTGAHVATVAGVAVLALGLGYGAAQLGGGEEEKPAAPAKTSARSLPSVPEAPKARIVSLGAAPVLPARARARPKRTPQPGNDGPSSTATPAPTSAPTAAPTAAPTSAPTAAPTPARTPDEGTIG